jgi:predicted TIM-barrel fold metal-dependent hydrolase
MLIVDAQVHLWTSGRVVSSSNAHHRQQASFTKDDLLPEMDAAGVDCAVIVPPSWGTNAHAIDAAAAHPDRFAVMGRIALDRPESRGLIANWRAQPGMLGLRLVFNPEHRALLTEGTADWIWPAAERSGLPLMVLAPGLLDRLAEIAERHPSLRLVVDHLGAGRNVKGEAAFAHLPQLVALAAFPNVAAKASGLPGYSAEPWPFRDLSEPIRRAFDAFGPDRFFWGTDLSRMPCSYRQCVTHFTEGLSWLSEVDKHRVMGGALCDWIGWRRPSEG